MGTAHVRLDWSLRISRFVCIVFAHHTQIRLMPMLITFKLFLSLPMRLCLIGRTKESHWISIRLHLLIAYRTMRACLQSTLCVFVCDCVSLKCTYAQVHAGAYVPTETECVKLRERERETVHLFIWISSARRYIFLSHHSGQRMMTK